MNKYKCLLFDRYDSADGYSLTPLALEHMEDIRQWRNAQMDVLRQQRIISYEEQRNYFDKVIVSLFCQDQPNQILFIFSFKLKKIGYGGLTNIDWVSERAEVSFLLDPIYVTDIVHYQQYFTEFLNLLKRITFQDLKLHRLYTETYVFRKEHIAILEDNGFRLEGCLRQHTFKCGQWVDSVLHGLLAGEFVNEK